MLDVFKPMPASTQREQRAAYREFLRERDGEPDYALRTLSLREERVQRYNKPLSRIRELDHKLFEQQYLQFNPKHEMSSEMLVLMAMLKLNAAEAYGVNRAYAKTAQRLEETGDELEMLLLLEETYHTKILLSASCLFGFDVTAPYSPKAALRALIGGIVHTPEFLSRPLTLAGEILGTLVLVNLLSVTQKRLSHDPELRDALEERIIEVLVDEIGHISFNRMVMGKAGLAQTRVLLPIMSVALATATPEVGRLGVMPADPIESILRMHKPKALPESVRRQAFIA